MNAALYWISGVILLFLLAGAFFLFGRNSVNISGAQEPSSLCTMDVKLCPDGSYVGRIPPSCAFATCPVPGGAEEPDVDVKG
ncbi:MAG TPA: hypothetical protein VD967_03480 [Candidatus Paceibacterota bacterium]|nr:hypothetical protein [Candidatus Paceibacterota bacterium]